MTRISSKRRNNCRIRRGICSTCEGGLSSWLVKKGDQGVTPDTPPCFLWHTAEDPGVPVENSLMFATALRQNGVPFELHVYERGAHGLDIECYSVSYAHLGHLLLFFSQKRVAKLERLLVGFL